MQTILITGANGNLGSYIAHHFHSKNYILHLLVHDNDSRIIDLVNRHSNVYYQKCDLNNLSEVVNACEELNKNSGSTPDIIIHTASIRSSDFSKLEDSNPKLWYKIIQSNLFSTFNLLHANLPVMKASNYGRIILFGSNVSRIGLKMGTAYAASKAAVANLARSLALELEDYDITVNTVSPGPIKIDDSHFSEEYRDFRKEYYARELELIPKKRLAEYEDILNICKFLTDKNSRYISGEEFFVTGGKL